MVGDHLACAGRAALGVWMEADDGAVDRAPASGVLPVLGPIVFDGAAGLADVLEVGSAEVFVLLDVEPEVENVLCALSLEKETGVVVSGQHRGQRRGLN